MNIAAMGLTPRMAARATELQTAFPTVVYTSGRRTLQAQAHAMAVNTTMNRNFIRQTYVHAALLQTTIDAHPEAVEVSQIENLLVADMNALAPADLNRISRHLTGDAVDLLPMEDDTGTPTDVGAQVIAWIKACPDTDIMLLREAGLVKWHWQITPSSVEV